jgi:hypothetical protein
MSRSCQDCEYGNQCGRICLTYYRYLSLVTTCSSPSTDQARERSDGACPLDVDHHDCRGGLASLLRSSPPSRFLSASLSMPRLSVNKPSDTSSPRRRSWFSLKRHVQAPPHASPPLPNVPHVPDLIASGPSSSSSHETPPTPADRCSGDDFPLKRPHIRSRLSEDAYTSDDPHPPQHNVHVSPSAVTLPRTHAVSAESPKRNSLVSLIRDSSRKARKLRKLTSSRPDTMPPPSAFPAAIFQRHHEPHIFSGTVSVPAVTMRPTARMARIPSDQIFAPQQLYTSMDPSATAPALTQYTLYPPSPVLADCSTPSDSGSSLALNTPAHVSPDASSTSLTPQSPNRRRVSSFHCN